MPYKNPEDRKAYYQKHKVSILARVTKRYREKTEEVKAYAKVYYTKNRKQQLQVQAAYRKEHKAIYRAVIDRWMEKHRAEYKAWKKEWQKEWSKSNRDRINATYAKRRALKMDSLDETTDFKRIKEFYTLAQWMTEQLDEQYVVDHKKPLAKGGKHHQDNLQVISSTENLKKGKKYPFVVLESFVPAALT